jgi:type I restriction enzyme R subunit
LNRHDPHSGLNEQEARSRFITPALVSAGWDLHVQVREEFQLTPGRIILRGLLHTRGAAKRADYVLFYKPNLPLAVVEAKDPSHSIGSGMQQALAYAEMLDVPFAISSNGRGFLLHDRTVIAGEPVERELTLEEMPSPADLWLRYERRSDVPEARRHLLRQEYHLDQGGRLARYYQAVAVNRSIEAIARGDRRLLLVMATGTGKTYTAFQIIWRMWRSGAAKRVLFLVDRNILADQALVNDFRPFGGAMTKISKRQVDKSYEVYLALYQAVSGAEELRNIYKEFPPDFFDLIVVDECHRGSAADDSAWREILDYFTSAIHIGLTATPRETKSVSNIEYFGPPVFTYSLRQGIDDGFLAPFKVLRVELDRDLSGWRPEAGKADKHGQVIEDRVYGQSDFDRTLILEQRTRAVAKRVSDYLRELGDRRAKTIVFCEDIDHAERMRQALVNENSDLAAANSRFVVRITGDSKEGKAELDNFIDPASTYPVIATTSKLMTTGVDAQTCKVIVIDQTIRSMTEFKQIIGRGTRVREDYGKYFFTIIDLRRATELFADPEFDGEPIQVLDPDPKPDPEVGPPRETEPRDRYVVDDVEVKVLGERVQYFDRHGRLITESLRDYTRKTITAEYADLDSFIRRWSAADKKEAVARDWRSAAFCWTHWPKRSAGTTTPSIWSATSRTDSRR